MSAAELNRLARLLGRFPKIAAVASIAAGALVLLGWLFDMDTLKSGLPGLTAMKANTALAFILSGVALWGSQPSRPGLRIVSQVCASVVLLLGLLTLGEYLSGVHFGIDQLLIRDITNLPGDIPGRMAVNTALSFAALGAALLLLSQRQGNLVVAIHALAIVPIIAAGSALIGYAFDIEEFLRAKLSYTPMAANTATVFVLLTLGVVTARPDYPFRRLMTSDSAAGVSVRRLLPSATGFTFVTGWLILQGYHAGYFGESFGLGLFAATSIAGLSALILWNAEKLYEAAALREQAEERNRYLAAIVESSGDAIIGKTLDGVITSWNRGAERMYGYTANEAVGQPISIVIPPEHQDERRRILESINAGEHVEHVETVRRKKDGERVYVSLSISPIREPGGNIVGAASVARDITERKQAEEKLRVALQYARSLIEASLDPLVTISAEGKITDVNKATEEATGLSRSELIGTDFADYFTEPEKAQASYRQALEQGFVRDYPLTIRHRTERLIDVLYNASVYRDEAGNILGVFAAARDITERKQAEESIRISQARFSAIFNQAPLGIALIDSLTGKIHEVNPRFAEIAGRSIEEMATIDWMSITHPDDVQEDLDNMALLNAGKIPGFRMDKRYLRPDGSFVWINMTIAPLREEQNSSPRHLCMIDDITERKQTEEEVRRLNAELEQRVVERTAELESFSYSVSHDLRVPLRAIDGFSRLVLKQYEEKLDDEGKRLLNVVRDNTKRMGQLIDDILAFSRAGRLEIRASAADMEALAREVWQELEPSIAGREVRLDIKPMPSVQGDPAMLRQVWANLLGNAAKFTKSRTTAHIEVGSSTEGNECTFYVKDNGVGFDMQYVDKLFGVFQRLHGVAEFEGTGIGLAIVKRIITRHGGKVWAEGKVNEGATFYFALPVLKEKRS